MSKYYFADFNDDGCHTISTIEEMMKEQHIELAMVEEAKPELGNGYFYCSAFGEIGDSSDSNCGRACEKYEPRNGKNGRCRFSGHTYEGTGKSFALKINPSEFT